MILWRNCTKNQK